MIDLPGMHSPTGSPEQHHGAWASSWGINAPSSRGAVGGGMPFTHVWASSSTP